jgi:type IV secretory pathway VirB10-like protein
MKKMKKNDSVNNKAIIAVGAVILAIGAFLIFQKSPETTSVDTTPVQQEVVQPTEAAPEVLPPAPAEPSLGASSTGLAR